MSQYIITEEKLVEIGRSDISAIQINAIQVEVRSHPYNPQAERDIEQLKKAIVEVLDTGFESSERDMMLVMDRIEAWEKGELRQEGKQEQP